MRHLIVFTMQDKDTDNQIHHNSLSIKQIALFHVSANADLKYLYWLYINYQLDALIIIYS